MITFQATLYLAAAAFTTAVLAMIFDLYKNPLFELYLTSWQWC